MKLTFERRQNWVRVVFDGYSNHRQLRPNMTYEEAVGGARSFPPGYIWSVEPANKEMEVDNQ